MRPLALVGLALALVTGCSSDATGPSVSLEGSYSLRTIDGFTLPYTFSNGVTLTSDVLTLSYDGSFQDVSTYRNAQTSVHSGYFTSVNGSAVSFTDVSAGISYQGSLSGSVLTEIVSGFTQAYQKN